MTPRVGIEWAAELEKTLEKNLGEFDCIELIPENFFSGRHDAFLSCLAENRVPVLVHAVELSIGSAEPLKQGHLDQVLRVSERINTVNVSDHLCFTEAGGVEIGQLTPLPWSSVVCDAVCRNIDSIQRQLDVPFAVENIANRFEIPDVEWSETTFLNQILQRTGCRLLLDLHNLHANAENFSIDPFEWIDGIDLTSLEAVHLAGGHADAQQDYVDSHSAATPDRVWDLYRFLCKRKIPPYTVVEWTNVVPPIDVLISEVRKAKQIVFGEVMA